MDYKKINLFLYTVVVFSLSFSLPAFSIMQAKDSVKTVELASEKTQLKSDVFLIISSFNPSTSSATKFIVDFESALNESYPNNYTVFVEDLAVKNFSEEAWMWKGRVETIINKYTNQNLKFIIAIGQEAWAALISQTDLPKDVLIFGSFISATGINLPTAPMDETWEPQWINSARKARRLSLSGGSIVSFSPFKNIELILSYFPQTKNIAVITDNTYGGVSLKTYFQRCVDKMPQLNYIYLDSRINSMAQLSQAISKLPKESAIVIGAWKVNKDGQHYLPNSLENLLSFRPEIPVFTLTGAGLESVAIGGYIPLYNHSALNIANQIINYQKGNLDSLRFIGEGSLYSFNHKKVEEFKITEKNLPLHSRLVNVSDPRIKTYKNYLYIISVIAIILACFIVALSLLYTRNQRLRSKLEQNSEELIKAKKMAEESDRLKSAFLANMSHEIRTPLNSIVGFSNLLTEDDFPPQERKKATAIIAQNSELLLTLITDILDISGLETGRMVFLLKEANVNDVCNQVMSTTAYMQKEEIEYRFIPKAKNLKIKTDAHRLSQVLLNLIANSTKFTEKGSITLTYDVLDKDTIQFSITDTGIGVPADKHYEIFERFGKIDTFRQGNGLGLAISKQIVTRLGGKIWIDPDYSSGARFYFTHPL
ncbi:MAG: HAMP domain-containing sensor histidine kinase [Bacteroidales bacterium]